MHQSHRIEHLGSAKFVTAILLAGGAGDRFGGSTPKQFALLAGEPAFVHPLRVLVSSPSIEAIVVVLPAMRDLSIDEASRLPKVCSITRGGKDRQSSLAKGLASLPPETDVVLVHDAARPFLAEQQISGVLSALEGRWEGAISAVPLEDSLKRASGDEIVASVDRDSVWRAQTPQAFRRPALEKALHDAQDIEVQATDCSELLTRAGLPVKVVEGDPFNIKLTRPADLELAELIMRSRSAAEDSDSFDS